MTDRLALVMGGGGARAAYQVGLLRFLARECPELRISILSGVSAGAINTMHMANTSGPFPEVVAGLQALWQRITVDQVFATDLMALTGGILRWGTRLLSGGRLLTTRTRGLVDTAPLRRFLANELLDEQGGVSGIQRRIDAGELDSVALTTTHYGTGQSITWVQGRYEELWVRPQRRAIATQLTLDHLMASAALPLFFPAVRVGDDWHGDGGVRLLAPLAPAFHLGATRILAVSTRYRRGQQEADMSSTTGYPPPAQVAGVLMNAVFLDMLDYDALVMERMNQMVSQIPESARGRRRVVGLLVQRPSQDLGKLSADYEPRLPRAFRFLTRGLGSRETRSPDFLSMLMFQPDYAGQLMDLGLADAEARGDEILAFANGAG